MCYFRHQLDNGPPQVYTSRAACQLSKSDLILALGHIIRTHKSQKIFKNYIKKKKKKMLIAFSCSHVARKKLGLAVRKLRQQCKCYILFL